MKKPSGALASPYRSEKPSRPFLPLLWGTTVLAILTAALFPAAGQEPSRDWPQFLGPNRNGVYSGPEPATWGEGGPPLIWKREVGQGFSGPVVTRGKLILFHRVENREVIECLDAQNGRTLWTHAYPSSYRDDFGFDEGPRATPTVAGNRIYTFGAQGMLTCLELGTGRRVWSVDTQQQFGTPKGFFGAACSPLVEDNRVLLNIGGKNGAGLVALDAATGETRWKATNEEASYSSPVMATIGGSRHVLFFTAGGLVAANPATGQVHFRFPWRSRSRSSVNAATPVAVENLIFLSASYSTGAVLLRAQGSEVSQVWSSDEVLSNHYSTSVYSNGYLYGFHGRQEYGQSLRCVELRTGKVRWTVDLPAGSVILAGKRLLVLTEKGELILAPASPDAFQPAARARILPATVRSYPALAQGRLYVRNEGTLASVKLSD